MEFRNHKEATAYAETLREVVEGTLRDLGASPSLAASILTDIDEYAYARLRAASLAAGAVLAQTT